MKEILESIIKSLVEKPEAVLIEEVQKEKETILKVTLDSKDMGRVIGRQGRMAKAIRTVVKAIATKQNQKVIVEFVD